MTKIQFTSNSNKLLDLMLDQTTNCKNLPILQNFFQIGQLKDICIIKSQKK